MSWLFIFFVLVAIIIGYVTHSFAVFGVALLAGIILKVMINLNSQKNESY